ncbi:probable 3-beta-hydroxysteroid-Delta(8),Delta(7)-isomerase [Chenopodium quinoa]|uniref:probable 3-beta-hydroxysteroid-Delta(8),Delta(7)-isomerase n=1 Tax=Chenopodium quinoa TaxID=63459 RepID=UPI000B78B472|nr:probable 3-beta-hydroxysteroid-Delta(8),Delta(7)-isomerase [Chenopodium quinoa]
MEVHLPNFPKDFNVSDFIPNIYSATTILGILAAASTAVFCLTWILSGKEYSKGDSRYLSFDSTIIALEAISIFIFGPANLLAAYALATHKSYRYAIQLVVCSMEFYSVVIYYMTVFVEGNQVSASPYYFYAYFILANSPWVIVPSIVIITSWRKICEFDGTNKSKVQ